MGEKYDEYAKVAQVIDAYTFVINRGSECGIGLNDHYLVFGLGDNVTDPDTGEDLGALEIVKGRAIVKHVQNKISTLESSETKVIPGTVRKVRRNTRTGMVPFFQPPEEEEIEEGTKVRKQEICVEVGDYAKTI